MPNEPEKRKTISTRWKEWAEKEPFWAYSALLCFALAMAGLTVHLGILSGAWRTYGLITLVGFDSLLLGITWFRKQFWWFWFFAYVTFVVVAFEGASYFLGGA